MTKFIQFFKEFPSASKTFLSEVKVEWSKVTKPARQEVFTTTVVVVLTSVIFAVYLWMSDLAIMWLYKQVSLLGL